MPLVNQLNIQRICFGNDPKSLQLRESLEKSGACSALPFRRIYGGDKFLSIILVGMLAVSILTILSLNEDAKKSSRSLIRSYRLSWRIVMATALIKLVLLIPLLAYGCFEFTVLLMNMFVLQLIVLIILGGVLGLGYCLNVLLQEVPLEFFEPMSREITPTEAPELWQVVRHAAECLKTAAPDRIIIGMQFNFFVTELAVKIDAGRVQGRTLFLSYILSSSNCPRTKWWPLLGTNWDIFAVMIRG